MFGTTFSGYTDETRYRERPDFDLVKALVTELNTPIIAKGNVDTPEQAKRLLGRTWRSFCSGWGSNYKATIVQKKFVEGMG
ncbi:hypothetical protein ABRT01_14735 [Lentibacillus sp. L22]|uniref:hypothetical protein n=1 Tax=Lentibacillus TaxID=175304 RepID=UPI0022B20A96|nr:hypothetical protein [Lentibacillus daqui]